MNRMSLKKLPENENEECLEICRLSGFDQSDYPTLLFYHAIQHAASVKGGMETKFRVRVRMNGMSVNET
jgi:hypothetical protein